MSEKGIFFKKRKNKHGSHGKESRGSEFPRNNMNYYEGTHLGMSKHLIRRGRRAWIRGGWENRGFIKDNILTPLINKYIGKPYYELVKDYHNKTKKLRAQHKDVGLDKLNVYFQNFEHSYYFRRSYGFYIDSEGIVRTDDSYFVKNNFTNTQLRYNRDQEIPQYGKVCRKYRKVQNWYYSENFPLISDKPVFMGNFYCDINGEIFFLPVYHMPYFKDCDNLIRDHWIGYVPSYLKPNTSENKKYLEMCSKWVKPIIAIRRNEIEHTFKHSYTYKIPNETKKELLNSIEEWKQLQDIATSRKDKRYYKLQLKVLTSKYESTPDFIEMEAGYGRLYPMVKREDYEKAKRE